MLVTVLFGALFTWLTSLGIGFSEENLALITTAAVLFFSGLIEAGIALLQRLFPNWPITKLLAWLLVVPIKPVFLTKREVGFILEQLPTPMDARSEARHQFGPARSIILKLGPVE